MCDKTSVRSSKRADLCSPFGDVRGSWCGCGYAVGICFCSKLSVHQETWMHRPQIIIVEVKVERFVS